MDKKQSNTSVVWKKGNGIPFSVLTKVESCDACIVGAGIAGLSIAYQLLKEGKSVIILDKGEKLSGETSLSSAHLTNAMDDRYYNLENYHGWGGTKLIANSHSEAIDRIEKIISEENINCDFTRLNGYLIEGSNGDEDVLKKECQAVTDAGIDCLIVPMDGFFNKQKIGSALMFPKQAQFNPLKYVEGLQEVILKNQGMIYGNALVTKHEISGSEVSVFVGEEKKVICKQLVYATNVPVNHSIMVHTKEAAYRSYVIGVKIPKDSFPNILMWDTEDPYHYLRVVSEDDHDILVVGGEDHRVGQTFEYNQFKNLKNWLKQKFGISGRIKYQWSGQIIETIDGLAYIGKAPGQNLIYEVSGDSGHGLTHGTIASMIIPDLIMERDNAWTELYSPSRVTMSAISKYIKENVKGVIQNVDWLLPVGIISESDIDKDSGFVIGKDAVYKDTEGSTHRCSGVCPHMGALVRWNEIEKTWDCPFHGSRFGTNKQLINGPATNGLKESTSIQQEIQEVRVKSESQTNSKSI